MGRPEGVRCIRRSVRSVTLPGGSPTGGTRAPGSHCRLEEVDSDLSSTDSGGAGRCPRSAVAVVRRRLRAVDGHHGSDLRGVRVIQEPLDLRRALLLVRRRKIILATAAALGLLAGAGYAVLSPPTLTAQAWVVLAPPPQGVIAGTQAVIAGSDPVLADALKD